MANYENLKQNISSVVRTNGKREITGNALQDVLNNMVNTLGDGYRYIGLAAVDTDPGTPDGKVFYLAQGKGVYTGFGITIDNDGVNILKWDGAWSLENILTLNVATSSSDGLMSKEDKIKFDSFIEAKTVRASFTGGGIYEKGTTKNVTVAWSLMQEDKILTPDHITINDEEIPPGDTSRTYTGVTDTTAYNISIRYHNNTYNGTVTAKFVNPTYIGVVDNDFVDTAASIIALDKVIKDTKSYTWVTKIDNQKICYAYPKAFGALNYIKDSNEFNYINSYKRTERYIHDEDYYVYVLEYPVTVENLKQVYI